MKFSTNISNKFSIIRYDFWCFRVNFWKKIDNEIDKQMTDTIFNAFNIIFDVKTEKRDDFDAKIEREIISTQNIDFFDVAKFVKIDFFDVTIDVANEIKKNELSMIDFDWLINNVNINVDLFDNKNVAKNVNVSIVVIVTNSIFDVKKNVCFANSFDANFAFSLDVNLMNSFVNFVNFWW